MCENKDSAENTAMDSPTEDTAGTPSVSNEIRLIKRDDIKHTVIVYVVDGETTEIGRIPFASGSKCQLNLNDDIPITAALSLGTILTKSGSGITEALSDYMRARKQQRDSFPIEIFDLIFSRAL